MSVTLRAITVTGKTVDIGVTDVPVMIDKDSLALIAKPNSELLYAESIHRCDIDKGYEEYRYVCKDKQFLGYIIYDDSRFRLLEVRTGNVVDIPDESVFVLNSNWQLIKSIRELFTTPTFTFEGETYSINSVLGLDNDAIIIWNGKSDPRKLLHIKSEKEVSYE